MPQPHAPCPRQVEQAALLYAESWRATLEPGTAPPAPVPPPPPPRAVLAPLAPRCRQLLLLLWARAAAPSAAPVEQLGMATHAAAATPEGSWPGLEAVVPGQLHRPDIALRCEPVEVPADGGEPPQAWVYLSECVPFDTSPVWASRPRSASALPLPLARARPHPSPNPNASPNPNRGGCKCVAQRKGKGRCGDGSACCTKGAHDECQYGCACAVRPKGERACEKRSLQMGQAKKLRLKRAEGKGWGVFADEQVGGSGGGGRRRGREWSGRPLEQY